MGSETIANSEVDSTDVAIDLDYCSGFVGSRTDWLDGVANFNGAFDAFTEGVLCFCCFTD